MNREEDALRELIRRHLSDLKKRRRLLISGTGSAETVHKMRVSTRRLRQVLVVLESISEDPRLTVLTKKIRKLTRALGPCRSLDVSLGILKKEFAVWDRMASDFAAGVLEKERAVCEKKMWRALKKSGRLDLENTLKKPFVERRLSAACALQHLGKDVEKENRSLKKKISKIRKISDKKLHKFRIRIKKLRYRVEILSEIGKKSAGNRLAPLKALQECLGQWHDRAVFAGFLKKVAGKPNAFSVTLSKRVDALAKKAFLSVQDRKRDALVQLKNWQRVERG
jgi:CHAD domain-containing protein